MNDNPESYVITPELASEYEVRDGRRIPIKGSKDEIGWEYRNFEDVNGNVLRIPIRRV